MIANTPQLWQQHLPKPGADSHKYMRGHALICGGGLSSTGAARLAALSALRSGAGLVTVASPHDALAVYAVTLLAVMVRRVESPDELPALIEEKKITAALIGPGHGVNAYTKAMVQALLGSKLPLVLDADALTSFRQDELRAPGAVLTPHEGEFARIYSFTGSREEKALAAAKHSGAVLLLKGSETIITSPDGRIVLNKNAPQTLATAGSGDVLSGIITGLLAQGMPTFEAACAGAWLHGEVAKLFGVGLIAEDLPGLIPQALALLTSYR